MFKKLNKMKIGARLKKSFRQIILIFGILSALVVVIMLYTINNYGNDTGIIMRIHRETLLWQ